MFRRDKRAWCRLILASLRSYIIEHSILRLDQGDSSFSLSRSVEWQHRSSERTFSSFVKNSLISRRLSFWTSKSSIRRIFSSCSLSPFAWYLWLKMETQEGSSLGSNTLHCLICKQNYHGADDSCCMPWSSETQQICPHSKANKIYHFDAHHSVAMSNLAICVTSFAMCRTPNNHVWWRRHVPHAVPTKASQDLCRATHLPSLLFI